MTYSMSVSPWAALADKLDPPASAQHPELRDPVSLAHHLDDRYQVRAHARVMGEGMAWLERVWVDRSVHSPRLMVNTPPQVGKSRLIVEWGAFWWLCRHPETSIIIGCYGEDLAEDRGGGIRTLVEKYGDQYGLILKRGSSGLKDWSITAGGSVRSAGIGSGIAGHNGDLIFIDDPIRSRADADSLRKRDTTYRWYTADMLTRLAPRAPMIMIQTPWDPDDLRGRVLKQEGDDRRGGRWRVVVMPALARTGERVDKESEETVLDPLGRAHGEPIPHPKVADGDTAELLSHWHGVRAAQSVRDWQSLYQCDPKPQEGVLLSWDLLRERRCYETGRRACSTAKIVAVAVDPSGGGRDVAGVIGGYLGEDNRVHITHDVSAPMSADAWARAACMLATDTGADRIIYETNYGADMVLLAIRTAWQALRQEDPARFSQFVPRLVPVHAKRGKQLRAEPIAQQWKEDKVVTAAYLPELEGEWATWQPTDTDSPGRLDASVYLAFSLLPIPTSGSSSMAGARKLASTNLLSFGAAR